VDLVLKTATAHCCSYFTAPDSGFCLELFRQVLPQCLGQLSTLKERAAMLNSFVAGVKKFIVSEDGPTAVEYAVMLALIVIVCLTSIQAIGSKANTAFDTIQSSM
jgi:pilus assembly protein Flp/PilA